MADNEPIWQTLSPKEAAARLNVDPATGLAGPEAARRLAEFGLNQLRARGREGFLEELLEELTEPMILLLLGTGILYSLWGELEDSITIFAVIIVLVLVEVVNERRAAHAIAALHGLSQPQALVRRGGTVTEISAEAVVPGDVVLLAAGRLVPADVRLLEAQGLTIDESSLTGESAPVEKETACRFAGTALADRRGMAYTGTIVCHGRGEGVVVATGSGTELGRVAALAQEVKPPKTLMQLAMNDLSRRLVWLALGFSLAIPLLGLLRGAPLQLMVLTGLSLAFATIPEEMPIIITMVLALGGYRLSRRNAIVRDLRAVETLGAITVIATDKTGTLTENRMRVAAIEPPEAEAETLRLGVLCSDAALEGTATGDPMDLALLRRAAEVGIDTGALRREHPMRAEYGFDNARRLTAVVYSRSGGLAAAVKGAPESIVDRSANRLAGSEFIALTEIDRTAILARAEAMAACGLRVLALAERQPLPVPLRQADAEAGLAFVALVAFEDPLRPEVLPAIAAARAAGVRTIMVTGDHPLTAAAIARQVGLDGTDRVVTGADLDATPDSQLAETLRKASVFARTTPEHKLRLVRALQAGNECVAVTGDGTNDAPALVAADVGVAMGASGTDVARQAADMVLADDNFATIVAAVEQGRILYANLSKAVRYYLACKVALVLASLLPVLLGVPVAFAPLQIILMELFMDLAAAATFVAEPPEGDLMHRPPRDPRARFMDRAMASSIFTAATGLFAAVSVAYLTTWYSGRDVSQAQTVAFFTWMLGHVFLALNMRSEREPLWRLGLFGNRLMVLWAAGSIGFVLITGLMPAVREALRATALEPTQWLLVVGAALLGTFWMEARKLARVPAPRNDAHGTASL